MTNASFPVVPSAAKATPVSVARRKRRNLFEDMRVMIVGAHADDIEINAGGLLAKISRGSDVMCLTMAHGSDPIRKAELQSSMDIYGDVYAAEGRSFSSRHFDFEDTRMYLQRREIVGVLSDAVREFQPDVVVTHFRDNHQDHQTICDATLTATRRVDNLLFFKPTYPSGRGLEHFNANFLVDLDPEDMELKLAGVRCHASQICKYGDDDYLESVRAVARCVAIEHGNHHGYAEVYQAHKIRM